MSYGLLSYTYNNADGALIETKIYVYPKTAKEAMAMGIAMPSKYVPALYSPPRLSFWQSLMVNADVCGQICFHSRRDVF